tara:strand:+ start:663 stop:782 length:120 start_codon:yes stop_codon:yes gene_type:complete
VVAFQVLVASTSTVIIAKVAVAIRVRVNLLKVLPSSEEV